MKRFRKFLNLTRENRRLLVAAAAIHGAIWAWLKVFPFLGLCRLLVALPVVSKRARAPDPSYPDRVGWAVSAVHRAIPVRGTCLTNALVTHVLLAWRRFPAHLRIGVIKNAQGELLAHAWVECQNKVVIGGAERDRYIPLFSLKPESRERHCRSVFH